ncbi:MAG: transposase [Anaerolineales bacterium]|nr:transposase [Anaerolineales bacterium]
MFPIIELPEIVRHYTTWFEAIFSEEALIQFQRYLSGLILSENKTVAGINRIMVYESRNQSSLNRLLTSTSYSERELNQQRLALLDSLPDTRMKAKGVLSVDDTHLIHYGQAFDGIAILWDPVGKRYAPAHNLVTLHYSDDQTDYPLYYQLWQPAELARIERGLLAAGVQLRADKVALKESKPKKWRQYLLGVWSRKQADPQIAALYESKLLIARRQLAQFVAANPELNVPVTFDNWYTQPAFCRYLSDELNLPYVGTLADDDQVVLKGGKERLEAFANRLKAEHLAAIEAGEKGIFHKITISYKGEQEQYYSYCRTHTIHNFGKQRLVINFSRADLSDSPRFYNSNRLNWQATGISRIRRHRWPVEVYHQEGKAEGLDKYQVRDLQAISRHIGLVATTYSLLRAASHDHALKHKLQRQLKYNLATSAPAWRRATQAQSLWSLATFIAVGIAQGQSLTELLSPLVAQLYA